MIWKLVWWWWQRRIRVNGLGLNARWILSLSFLFLSFLFLSAQTSSDAQLWVNGYVNYTLDANSSVSNEIIYQTLLSNNPNWYSINMKPAYEYSLSSRFDLIAELPMAYTKQYEGTNTAQLGVMLGTRIYFTPYRRTQLLLLVRDEERWIYNYNQQSWNPSNRIRIRGEVIYPINNPHTFMNRTWYAMADAEAFIMTNEGGNERYSGKTRFRAGLGYRLNYNYRFEAFYVCQYSSNTFIGDAHSVTGILRLKFKYYF